MKHTILHSCDAMIMLTIATQRRWNISN